MERETMREASAIELHSGEQRLLFVRKNHEGDGFFTPRHLATLECDMLKVSIEDDGTMSFHVINWIDTKTTRQEYSYNGKYIVHWARQT